MRARDPEPRAVRRRDCLLSRGFPGSLGGGPGGGKRGGGSDLEGGGRPSRRDARRFGAAGTCPGGRRRDGGPGAAERRDRRSAPFQAVRPGGGPERTPVWDRRGGGAFGTLRRAWGPRSGTGDGGACGRDGNGGGRRRRETRRAEPCRRGPFPGGRRGPAAGAPGRENRRRRFRLHGPGRRRGPLRRRGGLPRGGGAGRAASSLPPLERRLGERRPPGGGGSPGPVPGGPAGRPAL